MLSFPVLATPPARPEADKRAKEFHATPGKAVVYIYRSEPFRCDESVQLRINGFKIGSTVAKTYFRLELDPGTYRIALSGALAESVTLKTEASRVYYVWQEMDYGLRQKDGLQIVGEAMAREEIQDCVLLEGPADLPAPERK